MSDIGRPSGGGGHPRGGGGDGHGMSPHTSYGHQFASGRRGSGWWGSPWPDYYVNPVYALYTVPMCSAWGAPVTLTHELATIGQKLLEPSSGQQSASAIYKGVPYLFSFENGVMTARPCAARIGTLSAAPNMYGPYPVAGAAKPVGTQGGC